MLGILSLLKYRKGKSVDKDGQVAVVEFTKAASDVYSPISGEITEGRIIVETPESVNSDPRELVYFFGVKDKSELDLLMSKTNTINLL